MIKVYTVFSNRRTMEILGFSVLAAATVLSIIFPVDPRTLIPFPRITVPLINGICTMLCIPLIINPGYSSLEITVLFVQSISTVMTGNEILGAFLYSAMVIILFCGGMFKKHGRVKILILILSWNCILPGVIPYGPARVITAYTVSFFMTVFYACTYEKLKVMLVQLLPPQHKSDAISFPAPGRELYLSKYGLSDRQIKFTLEYLKGGINYRSLSTKYYVSVSTVKKDMAAIFRVFGVSDREELHIFLLQYIVRE
jgi:hypothetical protein